MTNKLVDKDNNGEYVNRLNHIRELCRQITLDELDIYISSIEKELKEKK